MSKRERLLAWAVALIVGFFVADRLLISPMQVYLSDLREQADTLEQQIDEDMVLVDNRELILSRWEERKLAGLWSSPASARLNVQGQVSRVAESSGLTLNNLSAGGNLSSPPFTEVRFSLTATGELSSVAKFLQKVQQAQIPLAVLSCDIARRDDSSNRLTLRLTVSTLVLSEEEGAS